MAAVSSAFTELDTMKALQCCNTVAQLGAMSNGVGDHDAPNGVFDSQVPHFNPAKWLGG